MRCKKSSRLFYHRRVKVVRNRLTQDFQSHMSKDYFNICKYGLHPANVAYRKISQVGEKENNNRKRKEKKRENNLGLVMATLNVRTLGEEDDEVTNLKRKIDRLPFLIEECVQSGVDVCCIQEVRRGGSGNIDRDGFTLFYNGRVDKMKRNGVGILIRKTMIKGKVVVKNVSERIMWIAGEVNGVNRVFMAVYALTNMYSEGEKLAFYEQLDETIRDIPEKYRKNMFIGGDFNARIGSKVDELSEGLYQDPLMKMDNF